MSRYKINKAANKAANFAEVIARTANIVVGDTYFKSTFYDREGSMVVVLSKSTKINSCGWPSSVEYKVISRIGTSTSHTNEPGYVGTCNACNLYTSPEAAVCPYKKVS